MSLTKRMEAIEAALAKQHGGGYQVIVSLDDESESYARARTGLTDWTGPVICLSVADANL